MLTDLHSSRWSRTLAWAFFSLFLLGFFYHPVCAWTGTVIGVWFVSSQRPWRGFLWMVATSFGFNSLTIWHSFSATIGSHGLHRAPEFLLAVPVAFLVGILPFTVHRLVSPRLPGYVSTLAFPLASVTFALALPLSLIRLFKFALPVRNGLLVFVIAWFASTMVWMWEREFRAKRIRMGVAIFASVNGLAAAAAFYLRFRGRSPLFFGSTYAGSIHLLQFSLACLACLSIWAIFRRTKYRPWIPRKSALARLQSPFTGNPLHVEKEGGRETLVSTSGERFPIRNGIPSFLKPQDLTGDNGKYNHVYETIGGFYDDIQRVFCALKGIDRDAHFRSYMDRLEVKPGDSVLETSVGTGLNYRYLPQGVGLAGIDLSPEMLAHCQVNLRRWNLDADLYLGNAESLPFAEESFDVVYHVGAINFFNDRVKAIREMIRVAKPGSLLLIADETEKHAKEVYEKQPGSPWKNRKEPVRPPVDLIPPEMLEVSLEELRGGDFYVVTFRKPSASSAIPFSECASAPSLELTS